MGYRKLGRTSAHRKAMLRNLVTALLVHGRIETTVTRAKEVRSLTEKMITLGKKGDLAAGLFVFHEKTMIYICIALIGFGNSNIFPVIFSQALLAMPQKKNEVSGLMIMGLFGGTVFPIAMGLASDAVGQSGAVAVMTVGVVYLFFYMLRMKR